MIPKSEHAIKAHQVRELRLDLDKNHCMSLSPFITAHTPEEMLARLKDFSEDVQTAVVALYGIAEKPPVKDHDRDKSVNAIADTLADMFDGNTLEAGLNKAFLTSVNGVQKSLLTLEAGIKDQRSVPAVAVNAAVTHLQYLGLFVDAVPQVYQRAV